MEPGLRSVGANLSARNFQKVKPTIDSPGRGVWTSASGVPVGYSNEEDQPVTPFKTGLLKAGQAMTTRSPTSDLVASYVKQRKAAGTKGY